MSDPNVTVFFRESKWRSPSPKENSKEAELSEIISDRDVTNLYELSMCILHLRKKAKDENRKATYDNATLEEFIDNFTLMIDEISRKKNIKDFIAHRPGPILEVSAPVKYI
jgi:hypothetical protein